MSDPVSVLPPRRGLGSACREILDALPDWFGLPEANAEYVAFVEAHPTWSAVDASGVVVGVLAPLDHAGSSEIYLIAVRPEWRRHGVGRALVDAFEADASARGYRLAHVKTLGPSHPDEGYALTREFYAALGYLAVEEIPDLWPDNPALVMVKPLPVLTGEAAVVARTIEPITKPMIMTALTAVGVESGAVVIVHSSLSGVGWVVGGARTVVEALLEAVGDDGTIVMPAQAALSDPATWVNPPVPESWHETIRANEPAFDPDLTPIPGMGQVAEHFRHRARIRHSGHPAVGFVARGAHADAIVARHPLEHALDDSSPLGRLYELDARIVLIGVDHDNNTSLHLAEHRADYPGKRTVTQSAPMMSDGIRRWVDYADLDRDEDDFVNIGAAFSAAGGDHVTAPLGYGRVAACSMRALVDFAVTWFEQNRGAGSPPNAHDGGE